MIKSFLLLFALSGATQAQDSTKSAQTFERIFLQQIKKAHPKATDQQIRDTHFLPDSALREALQAPSIAQAMAKGNESDLPKMVAATGTKTEIAPPAPSEPSDANLTMVIVPGVLAEFIKTRAFEEVFERPSKSKNTYLDQIEAAREKGDANASDATSLLKNFEAGKKRKDFETPVKLEDVVNVGEIEVNGKRVKVVLLGTPFGSLESLGDSKDRAAMFNRRLEKYLALTGPQNLALVGYSRGTVSGLEMLAQAKADNKPWVNHVKGMVSLSGVVWGSCLADDAVSNPKSTTNQLVEDLLKTIASLELIPEGASLAESTRIALANTAKLTAFGARAQALKLRELFGPSAPLPSLSDLRSLANVDPTSMAGMVMSLALDLGIDHPVSGYNKNIERFRYFTGELLAGIKEIGSDARQDWWKSREIPTSPIYYSMPAAMANPDTADAKNRPLEKRLYKNPLAYGNGSFDDASLLGNRKSYEKLCGAKANDSQVSVLQSSFLPNAIQKLNPKNGGIKTKFLGVAGTHHWGVALREVNKMKGGQRNGFPREALLRALAQQILEDQAGTAAGESSAAAAVNSAE